MSWSKRQFIDQAFAKLGLAPWIFDLSPEQQQSALRQMDAMIASWTQKTINIGYPLPSSPEFAGIDNETGVPDWAAEAIYTGLAIRLAPDYGKEIASDVRVAFQSAFNAMMRDAVDIREMSLGTYLVGAGAKTPQTPWAGPDEEGITVDGEGELEL